MENNGSGGIQAQVQGQAVEALAVLEQDFGPLVARAGQLAVKDGPSQALGMEMVASMSQIEKRAEDRRTYFTKPLNEIIRGINKVFTARLAPLTDAKQSVGRKLSAYQIEQERKAREAAAKQQAKVEKAIEKGREIPAMKPIEEPAKTIQATSGQAVTMRSVWKFKIIGKVPEAFLIPDEAKIGQFVRAMKDQAASEWLQVYEEKVPSVR